jgi:peroxiredoxin family protein
VGGLPGLSSVVTLYACQASVDLFGMAKSDIIEQVSGIITVGEFHDLAAGGRMIFT